MGVGTCGLSTRLCRARLLGPTALRGSVPAAPPASRERLTLVPHPGALPLPLPPAAAGLPRAVLSGRSGSRVLRTSLLSEGKWLSFAADLVLDAALCLFSMTFYSQEAAASRSSLAA